MSENLAFWTHVDAIASKLGVQYFARRKWRARGVVPHRWRIPLIQASAGSITADDLEKPRPVPKEGEKAA